LGGDEFAVVVSWAGDHSRPLTIADGIHAALASAVDLGCEQTRVSASVGIAYSADLTDTTELLRNADAAMYRAQAAAKHRSGVFQASMHASMLERYELLNQLDRAIENQEITILIQPLFGFDGQLRGARRSPVGTIRTAESSCPPRSFRWPRRAGSSRRSPGW